jgi:class 3 adenylate cyclase/tetratricopeptide (TPR) repeat protein
VRVNDLVTLDTSAWAGLCHPDMSCERCGAESPDGFQFCGTCGAPLPHAPRSGRKEERKVISALFCDVVGSTERAEGIDPEDVHRVLVPYYQRVRSELVRFGGTVEKFIGDAVVGFFGAPRTWGDDTERAVRAALAVRDTIKELNEADPELDLHVRLGVATGQAFVSLDARASEGEAMAWGDVNNTAARLQGAAPIDAILVDEATYRATRHAIDYGVAEPIRAKGKAEPILVWEAVAPRARRGIDLLQVGSEPLVGRGDDVSRLMRTLNRVGRQRSPELVTIVGEAGVGKSRLVVELFRKVELSPVIITWRQARSSPYGDGFTFWALGEIVKAQAGILETDSASVVVGKLGRAVRDVVADTAEAAQIEASLRLLVGIGATTQIHGDRRDAAFAAWRRFLEAVAYRRTLVLVFEDIHWADGGLLDFIEHVLEWSRNRRILVVCTTRPELTEKRPTWGGGENATQLALEPLATEEIAELVAQLGSGPLTDEDRESIVVKAAGSPLFAVELVRMVAEHAEHGRDPDSVQAVIAARLDALPEDHKNLLQDAAVVGRVIWPGVLSTIGDRTREIVEGALQELVRKQYLTRAGTSSVEGEPEYRFRHLLVRDVAYEQLPRSRRAESHRRAAEWLESLSPDRAVDRAEMLARHYLSAYEYALATRQDTAELVDGARFALRDAGDRALSLNAFAAAERHFRAAVDLWPDEDSERPWLLLRFGTSLYYANQEGDDVLTEAETRLVDAGDVESAAEAATFLARLAHQRNESRDRVFEHANRATVLVDGLEPSRSRTFVLLEFATWLGLVAEHEEAIRISEDALRDARTLELTELEADALAVRGMSRALTGDLRGRADLEKSIEITEEIGSSLVSQHCGMLAALEASFGNLERCFELQATAREHAERVGHSSHIQWLRGERVAEYYWTGKWDDAVSLAGELVGSGHFMEGYCRDMRGRVLLARGDVEGALADAGKALELARESDEPQMLYPALAFHAHALAASGALEGAGSTVDELLDVWRSKSSFDPPASWVVDLAQALDLLDRRSELVETAAGVTNTSEWLTAAVALASRDFGAAADILARIGSRPDEAFAHLRAAGMLADAGRYDEARDRLERALVFYREVGATAHLDQAAAVVVT